MGRASLIRVGVVGVGYLGAFHVQKYSKLKDVLLVGVADINGARASDIANKYSIKNFPDYKDLLREVDAVSIATPSTTHFEIAKNTILAGRDLLVEKPMTINLMEAEELVALADSKKIILHAGHIERFNAALVAARSKLKRPLFIESHRLGPYTPRHAPTDVIFDLMIHDIDLILSFNLGNVVSLDSVGVPVITQEIDIANARLKFSSGCIVNMTASRVSASVTRKLRVFQPDGYASIDFQSQEVKLLTRRAAINPETLPSIQAQSLEITRTDSLESEIKTFVEAVKTRNPGEGCGKDAIEAIRLSSKIRNQMNKTLLDVNPSLAEEYSRYSAQFGGGLS